jgi:hypothetical protein
LDEFFKIGKLDSKDTDPNRITATEYCLNIHCFPIYPKVANSLTKTIVNLKPETESDIKAWVARIDSVISAIKRVNVQ